MRYQYFWLVAIILTLPIIALLLGPTAFSQIDSSLIVTTDDLSAAGFTNPRAVQAKGSVSPTVYYFEVEENSATRNPDWGSVSNLVAVTIQKTTNPEWLYNEGMIEIIDIKGRTQARISRPGYYIAVTGPDVQKVTALAENIAKK